jgi:putative membrane protein
MKKTVLATLAVAAAMSATAAAGTSKLSAADRSFLSHAAQSDRLEIQTGSLAATTGTGQVRAFGKMLVRDHTKTSKAIKAFARSAGVTLPTGLPPLQPLQLNRLSGPKFAPRFLALYQREAKSGTNARVRAFAKKTLPVLRMHLQKAQSLRSNA